MTIGLYLVLFLLDVPQVEEHWLQKPQSPHVSVAHGAILHGAVRSLNPVHPGSPISPPTHFLVFILIPPPQRFEQFPNLSHGPHLAITQVSDVVHFCDFTFGPTQPSSLCRPNKHCLLDLCTPAPHLLVGLQLSHSCQGFHFAHSFNLHSCVKYYHEWE